jgi:hypothetical protein
MSEKFYTLHTIPVYGPPMTGSLDLNKVKRAAEEDGADGFWQQREDGLYGRRKDAPPSERSSYIIKTQEV